MEEKRERERARELYSLSLTLAYRVCIEKSPRCDRGNTIFFFLKATEKRVEAVLLSCQKMNR